MTLFTRSITAAAGALLTAVLLAGCSGGATDPAQAMQQRYDEAIAVVADTVAAANAEREDFVDTLQDTLSSFIDDFTTAMEDGDGERLLSLMEPEMAEAIRFTGTLGAWVGTDAITVQNQAIEVMEVTVPSINKPPVISDSSGESANAYRPLAQTDDGPVEPADYKPDDWNGPEQLDIAFTVGGGEQRDLSIRLVGDGWEIHGGDLTAPIASAFERDEEFAAHHLLVGERTIEAIRGDGRAAGIDDQGEQEILIGVYDLAVSDDWDQIVLEFTDLDGVDLHARIPVPTLTDEYLEEGIEHARDVAEASIELPAEAPECNYGWGFGSIEVNGVEEQTLFGCDFWEDNDTDEIEFFEAGDHEVDMSFQNFAEKITVTVRIHGIGAKPLLQRKYEEKNIVSGRAWKHENIDWIDVLVITEPSGTFRQIEVGGRHVGERFDI